VAPLEQTGGYSNESKDELKGEGMPLRRMRSKRPPKAPTTANNVPAAVLQRLPLRSKKLFDAVSEADSKFGLDSPRSRVSERADEQSIVESDCHGGADFDACSFDFEHPKDAKGSERPYSIFADSSEYDESGSSKDESESEIESGGDEGGGGGREVARREVSRDSRIVDARGGKNNESRVPPVLEVGYDSGDMSI
jgi:hypothetical protein